MFYLLFVLALWAIQSDAFTLPIQKDFKIRASTQTTNCYTRGNLSRRVKHNDVCHMSENGRKIDTRLHLFMGSEIKKGRSVSQRWKIPETIIDSLERNELTLPLEFPLEDRESPVVADDDEGAKKQKSKKLLVRQMNEEDVKVVARMCVREYGSYPSSSNSKEGSIGKFIDDQLIKVENTIFTFVVLAGMTQRLKRGREINGPSDHNVLCLAEIDGGGEGTSKGQEKIVGMAEVSLKSPDPLQTSPPFVLPTAVKEALSSSSGYSSLRPYISNVLISNEYRGKGYSKVLMAACEGLAKNWGFTEAYLHVDADSNSGTAPQKLYRSIGYEPVVNEDRDSKFDWMGPEMMLRGLYVVDGVPLLFLRKNLP